MKKDKNYTNSCETTICLSLLIFPDVLPNYFENSTGLDEFGDVEFNDIQFQHNFRLHRKSIQVKSK